MLPHRYCYRSHLLTARGRGLWVALLPAIVFGCSPSVKVKVSGDCLFNPGQFLGSGTQLRPLSLKPGATTRRPQRARPSCSRLPVHLTCSDSYPGLRWRQTSIRPAAFLGHRLRQDAVQSCSVVPSLPSGGLVPNTERFLQREPFQFFPGRPCCRGGGGACALSCCQPPGGDWRLLTCV